MVALAAAGIGAAGALGSGIIGGGASKSAAKTQSAAAQQAAQLQYQMYQQTANRLQPWVDTGTAAQSQLGGLLGLSGYTASGVGGLGTGALTTPFQPTMQQLSQTPGYQFTLQQGVNAVQNEFTAAGQGGGITPGGTAAPSGPEAQGTAQYAENLASTTYQQQFQNYWSQLNNIYNMLSGTSSTGANAAAGVGQAGQAAATGAGNALQAAGAAQAGGTVGAANALGGSLGGIGNIAQNYALISAIQKMGNPVAQGGGSGTGPVTGSGGDPFYGNTMAASYATNTG